MKKILCLIGCALLVIDLAGCASFKSIMPAATHVGKTTAVAELLLYNGPKAKITIADFEVKAAKASSEIGTGLREMLITALINSNRFSVVERQAQNAVMQEQELSAQGAAQSGPQRDKIKTADLIIVAAVTEFEPRVSGGRGGVGGGGGVGSGTLGGLLGATLNKAHMALDIRIVEASTSGVLASTRVQGQASDIAGTIMGGFFGSGGLGGGLSAYANTPMEKAIRVCIVEGVRYISGATPENYYKY